MNDRAISPSTVSVIVHETDLLLDHAERMLAAGLQGEAATVLSAADKLLSMTRKAFCATCGGRVDWDGFVAPESRCQCTLVKLD